MKGFLFRISMRKTIIILQNDCFDVQSSLGLSPIIQRKIKIKFLYFQSLAGTIMINFNWELRRATEPFYHRYGPIKSSRNIVQVKMPLLEISAPYIIFIQMRDGFVAYDSM